MNSQDSEPKPPEAQGPDLTQAEAAPKSQAKSQAEAETEPQTGSQSQGPSAPLFATNLTERQKSSEGSAPESRPRSLVIVAALLIAIVGLYAWALSRPLEARAESGLKLEERPMVQAQAIEYQDGYSVDRAFTGQIEAQRSTDLAFEKAGRLDKVLVTDGQRVEQGQVLAELDRERLFIEMRALKAQRAEAQAMLDEMTAGTRPEVLAQARAQLADAQALSELAKLDARRSKRLFEKRSVSQQQYDRARAQERSAKARAQAAKERLRELKNGVRKERKLAQEARLTMLDARLEALTLELKRGQLKAPYAGRIATQWVDIGSVLAPGVPVMRLVEQQRLEARVGVPSDWLDDSRLAVGQKHSLKVRALSVSARVKACLPELDPQTRTAGLLLTIEGEVRLEIGETVRLILSQPRSARGFWLPIAALSKSVRGLWACFSLVPDSQEAGLYIVRRTDVELLHVEGNRAYVRSSLDSGHLVLQSGLQRLVPNQKVRLGTQ